MNTLTTLKQLRENVSDTLGFAHISQTQDDAVGEAWWRGLAAAYSSTICSLIGSKDEHYSEWQDYDRIRSAQSARIRELKARTA